MSSEMNISEMLAEQVNRLLGATVNRDLRVKAENGMLDSSLWAEIENLGLTRAMCSESDGGADLRWAECEPVMRLSGAHAAPVPIGETLLASWILSSAGIKVPAGVIALATTRFAMDGQGKISGRDPGVSWLNQSGHVVLIATDSQGHDHVCLLQTSSLPAPAGLATIDRQPCATLECDGISTVQKAPAPASTGELGVLPYVATLRSIQMAGALSQILSLTIEYANTRVQFGRPIGKFQAIQHLVASLAGKAAAAQVAGLYAARQIDAGNAEDGAAIAKSLVSRYATEACAITHQVFGAIGVTDEHSLHFYTRRLWQWRAEAGSDHWWSGRLGKQVLSQPGSHLWEFVTKAQPATTLH
ncbi:MAG TPA: acyl-CoA dehydrogenase [Pseudomonas xinjiangensis]|uniref:Acyl-CoA dehydrogenase n=2 Tax=root TaxID=1 RepID=A0A7V1BL48_9GAMM|nr:acyl-CoA dehydrogenase [Halopseudomonas xinjiangensis]HEC47579.1 acyl-CoA dehydrogenase [Halopseudomonas xinjiangensis]